MELELHGIAVEGPLTANIVLSEVHVIELAHPELDGVVLEDTIVEEFVLVLDRIGVIVELVLDRVAVEDVLAEGLALDEVDAVGVEPGLGKVVVEGTPVVELELANLAWSS